MPRRTEKLASVLPATIATPPAPDTALGNWYANRIVVDRKPLLVLLGSRALLAILLPARQLRTLPLRLGGVVAQRPRRFGVEKRQTALTIGWRLGAALGGMLAAAPGLAARRAIVGSNAR